MFKKISIVVFVFLGWKSFAQSFPNLQFTRLPIAGAMDRSGNSPLMITNRGNIYSWDGFRVNTLYKTTGRKFAGWAGSQKIQVQGQLVWIKYVDGIAVYNKATNVYIEYNDHSENENHRLKSQKNTSFYIDEDGQVYVQGGAVYTVDKNLNLHEMKAQSAQLEAFGLHNLQNGWYKDRSQQLWAIFDFNTLAVLNKDKSIRRLLKPALFQKEAAQTIYQDSRGRYLIGTDMGLHILDTLTGQTQNIPLGHFPNYNIVAAICEWKDTNGANWIVLAVTKGIMLLNPITFEHKLYSNEYFREIKNALQDDSPDELFVDSENNLWVSSLVGVCCVAPANQHFNNFYLNRQYQYPIIPFPKNAHFGSLNRYNGNYWISGDGVAVLSPSLGFIARYPKPSQVPETKKDSVFNLFNQITTLPNGNALITSADYVCVLNKNGKMEYYKDGTRSKKNKPESGFNEILPYKKNRYLIASYGMVNIFDVEKRSLSQFINFRDSGLVKNQPGYLKSIKYINNSLWALFETALVQYDTSSGKIKKYFALELSGSKHFPSTHANNFTADKNANIWIACAEGILHYHPADDKFILLNDKNGVPENVGSILADKKNRVWFTQGDYLFCYDNINKKCTWFSANAGLPGGATNGGEYGRGGFFWQDSTNNIWFQGGNSCLTYFNPDSILNTPHQHQVYISKVLQGDSLVALDTTKGANLFTLPYYKSSVIFYAGFRYFNRLHKPMLAWRLSKNDDWKYSEDGTITFYSLGSGSYALQMAEALEVGNVMDDNIETYHFYISPPFYKTWQFFVAMFLLVGGVAFFWRSGIEKQKLKAKTLQNKMNELSLNVLRSQINPHFLFNCLNSIKLYTMENNNAAASDYLGKFSKLIRNTLDNSTSSQITLAAELESLKLYIELEAMRFKDKLKCEIKVDENVDTDFIQLPPLLIQPYIENAIWHGLMQKDEGGMVKLHIAQNEATQTLQISINDNGIGRAKAAELKSKSAMPHKSHGTRVTGERIALIKEKYGVEASVAITDLYDQQNQPAGTQVTIKIPLL